MNRRAMLVVVTIAAFTIISAYIVAGMLNRSPIVTKTTTLTTATWEIDRPRTGFSFYNVDEVGDTFNYSDLAIQAGIVPVSYLADPDQFQMSLNIEASGKLVYPESFNCTLHVNDANSSVEIVLGEQYNCSIVSSADSGTIQQDANILLTANSTSCSTSQIVWWIFNDQSYQTRAMEHTLNVSVECIYKNGSANEKVIFPIVLNVIPDAGNDFSTAENISFGTYNRTVDNVDFADFFAIQLSNSERISVSVIPPYDTSLAYTLFDPNHISVQHGEFSSTSVFPYDANATGNWYIEMNPLPIQSHHNEGLYTIAITQR